MKKFRNVLLVLTIASIFASCSNKKVKQDEMQAASQEEALVIDESDFIVDAEEKSIIDDAPEQITDMSTMEQAPMFEETVVAEDNYVQPIASPEIATSEYYEVKQGETLMWISFKLYGDYRKWRELQANNQDALRDGLQTGDKLRYNPGMFAWNPKGLPHLIKTGETLATISNDKYGTYKKWKNIWDNNIDMIKDPNLIFAGFTLYYVPEDREIASEQL